MVLKSFFKQGVSNSFCYALSAGIIRFINFLFLPYFSARLSLYEFGVWDFYQTFFSLGTVLSSSCAATSMFRYYLLYQGNPEQQRKAIGNSLLLVLVASSLFAFCVVCYLIFFSASHNPFYLGITLFNIVLFSLFGVVLAYLRVKEKLLLYFVFFCGQALVATSLTVVAVSRGGNINSFFYANCFSYVLFLPYFFYIVSKYYSFSYSLLKEQLYYSFPLFISSFLYGLFFAIDRYFLKIYAGFDALGIYSLLWRFGGVFQFIVIALMDTLPLLAYSAQHDKESHFLLNRMLTYFSLIFATFALFTTVASAFGIMILLPTKYAFLIEYLPIFLCSIFLMEIGRLFQIGFGLSLKTAYVPFLISTILGIQSLFLWISSSYGIWGLMYANSGAFLLYGIISISLCCCIWHRSIIDSKRLIIIGGIFLVHQIVIQCLFVSTYPFYYAVITFISWPLSLLIVGFASEDEKDAVKNFIGKKVRGKTIETEGNYAHSSTILYIRADLCPEELTVGGAATHTTEVIKGFLRAKKQVVCASSNLKSVFKSMRDVELISLKVPPILFFLRWKLAYFRWQLECILSNIIFIFQLKHVFKQHKVELIYQRYTIFNCIGVLLSRIKKVPLMLEYNGSETWTLKHWSTDRRLFCFPAVANFFEMINVRYATFITVVSAVLKDELIARGVDEQKILINPNGVDPAVFDPAQLDSSRASVRKYYTIENKFVFGFVGTFSLWHGIDVLAKIIPEVVKRNSQIHFLLIGTGILENSLRQSLARENIGFEHVTFVGKVAHDDVKNYLSAADAFLSPTQPAKAERFFGSPTKMFEYMSMAKPVIASNLEQLAELLAPAASTVVGEKHNDAAGFLVAPSDIQGFIDAICYVATLQEQQATLIGNNARQKILNYYSWDHHVERIYIFAKVKSSW